MSRYLITGGLGFIGSHLADGLAAAGHELCIIDDLTSGSRDRLPEGGRLIERDMREPGVIEQGLDGVDGCFHLAAIASVALCNQRWADCHSINVGATVSLFEQAAKRGIPVIYASSAAVYGDNPNVPLKESEPVSPLSPYGIDKAACEMHARAGASIHGLRSIGLRFFNVHGPRQRPDDAYAGVITIFRDKLARAEPITIYGDGLQTRDFIHVSDVVQGMTAAMHRLEQAPDGCSEIVNLCSGRETTILDLAHALAAEKHTSADIRFGPARAGEITRSAGCPRLAQALLGFSPQGPDIASPR